MRAHSKPDRWNQEEGVRVLCGMVMRFLSFCTGGTGNRQLVKDCNGGSQRGGAC